MLILGCHLSVAKGLLSMTETAASIGANTFQFFPRNPRGGKSKTWDPHDCRAAVVKLAELQFGAILCHGAYTMNGASPKEYVRRFARTVMKEDLAKISCLPHCLYNFHPGSRLRQSLDTAATLIADMINEATDQDELRTTVLLETMSGKGSEVGRTFEELAMILERTERPEHVGICLDTCHVFAGGYDIVNHLDDVLSHFNAVIGLNKLRAIHLNDDKNSLGSHKDRHAAVGEGSIGTDALSRIINHPDLRNLPFFLETPHDTLAGYAEEIKLLRSLRTDGFLEAMPPKSINKMAEKSPMRV